MKIQRTFRFTQVSHLCCSLFIALVVCIILVGCSNDLTNDSSVITVDSILARKTTDDLFQESSLVVLGSITARQDSFRVLHVNGQDICVFTDYTFTIQRTLQGESDSDTVTVRIRGGTVGNYTENHTASPSFTLNNQYLLFLYQPNMGGSFNTLGDYYYIKGVNQGVFEPDAQGNFMSCTETVLTTADFMSAVALDSINENRSKDEFLTNQKNNLDSGIITQEVYDQLVSSIDQYATIITE